MKTVTTILLTLISFLLSAQVVNDLCSGAIALPVNGNCQTFDNTGATASNNPQEFMHCGFNAGPAEDLWFTVAAPASGNFTIELQTIGGGPSIMIMELYGGSCAALVPVECAYYKLSNTERDMPIIEREGMNPGQSYYVRISVESPGDFGQFSICVRDQGYIDFPCKVEFIEASGQSICDPVTNTYTQELTIYYRDGVGQATGLFFGEFIPIQPSPMIVQITDLPANSGWSGQDAQLQPITSGSCYTESYYYAYQAYQRASNCYSGTVSNDECAGAIVIPVDDMCVAFTGNNLGATASGTGGFCVSFFQGAQDVWFQHTVNNTEDVIINLWNDSDMFPNFQVYTGTCGNLPYQDCGFFNKSIRLTGLSIGETIYIQVKEGNDDFQGDFGICLINPEPSTNDVCQNAIVIPANTNCSIDQVFSNHFATDDGGASQPPSCATFLDPNDLWYQVEVPVNGVFTASIDPANGSDYDILTAIEIYEGPCTSLQLLDCQFRQNSLQNFEIPNRTAGEFLYLRVISDFDNHKPYLICTPEVSNDICAGAEEILVGNCIVTDNYGATASDNPYPGLSCGFSGTGDDSWYKAIVPSSGNLTVYIDEVPNGLSNVNVELYEGAGCQNLIPIACSDRSYDSGNFSSFGRIELEGRIPGETIYIRVIENYGDSEGEFQICVIDAGYTESCKIELIEIKGQSSCDPLTNTYMQDILVSYRSDGSATHVQLLNQDYVLTGSPQLITVEIPSNGVALDVDASLNENFFYNDCFLSSEYFMPDAINTPTPCVSSPTNDECINAISLPVTKGCLENIYDNTGATYSPEAGFTCNNGDLSQDIWFTAVVPSSGELIVNTWQSNNINAAFEIYVGGCNNLSLVESCGASDQSIRLSGRSPGEVLYIAVYSANVIRQGAFGICAIEPEPLINDTCADAIGMPVSSSCAPQVFSTHFANDEIGSAQCNGNNYGNPRDIWFNVIVPNSGNLTLRTEEAERGFSQIFMEVFSGSCQSPFSTCASGNGADGHAEINIAGQAPGTQLQVRISGYNNSYNTATFRFCALSDCPDMDVITQTIQTAEDYEADISINSISLITTGAQVDFDAGQMIELDPGFEVESGAVFHAFIDGCGGI